MPGLVLVGASGLAREVASAVQASGSHRLVGVVDDDESRWGQPFAGVRVIGGLDVLGSIGPAELLLCPGKGASRRTLAGRIAHLGQRPRRYATIVHPRASVGSTCTVGAGSVLLAGVVLTSDVQVGAHVVLMPNVVATHDDVLDDYSTLCASVTLAGGVRVGAGAYVGAGALVRENLAVGAWSRLGMGAVLLRDLPAGETWVGCPARPMPHAVELTTTPEQVTA